MSEKMKSRNKIIFIVIWLFLFSQIPVSLVRAQENVESPEDEEKTIADQDTYAEFDDPTANNGGSDYFIVGEWLEATEAFLYFDFEDEPDNWKEVEISLDIYYVSETMKVNIYLVNNDWDELLLIWENKPIKGALITSFTVSEAEIYDFEVTDLVEDLLDEEEEGISICIYHSDNATSSGHVQATSSEGYYFKEDVPLLIWTYDIVNEEVISLNILISIIIACIAAGVGAVVGGILLYKKRKAKTKEPEKIEVKKEETKPALEKDKKLCPFCGAITFIGTNYCTNCGKSLI